MTGKRSPKCRRASLSMPQRRNPTTTTPPSQLQKPPKKEAPVGNGGVMTGNTAFVPNLLAEASWRRQRKVPSGTSIYHTRTPSQHRNQNSQSRRISTSRAVGLAPAIPSTPAKWGWNKKGASVEAPIGLNFPCGKGERIARTPTSASIPRHDRKWNRNSPRGTKAQ